MIESDRGFFGMSSLTVDPFLQSHAEPRATGVGTSLVEVKR